MKIFFTFLPLLTLLLEAAVLPDNGGVIDWQYLEKKSTVRYAPLRSSVSEQEKGLIYLNSLRSGAGLITFSANSELDTAAQNHTDYLVYHNLFGHYEDKDSYPELFTGTAPSDRITYAGYDWMAYSENVSAGSDTIYRSIDGLMSAIYHRFGFLNFNTDEIGIGISSDNSYAYRTAYNYDMANQGSITDTRQLNPAYVLWPYSGYNSAQTSFSNNESPDPLPECPSYGIAGNPVSVEFNPDKNDDISMNSFKIFNNDGTEITNTKILVYDPNHPDNPPLNTKQFVLFPMKSLSVDSRYNVEFSYSESGETKTLLWHFNTKRYENRHYEVTDGNSYDVVSGKTYIIHVKPADCTTVLNSYSWNNGNAVIERLSMDLFRISTTGDTTFYFPNSQSPELTFTLHIAPTDNAIAPSSQKISNIIPVIHYLLF
ncbi:MAG: hypothetical protein B5M52_05245 [Helicobacteraceae bacterium 4484_230]|nr:MAG: hypothetical protein B5M52_05245 [Helicobacteraceae bacterium 4484_230]